jgi:uroporphyrinogen decarboxylase
VEIGDARRRIGDKVALQGNMDPSILLTTPDAVSTEAKRILASYGKGSGHIFNLGHGISQFTPPENVATLVETVKADSWQYHI